MKDENETAVEDKIEPTFNSTQVFENTNEEYIHRVDLNSHKASMGVHPLEAGIPYPTVTVNGNIFYKIQDKYWQLGFIGSDDEGIFVTFWKTSGTYVTPNNIW